jgi:hypothetical protein
MRLFAKFRIARASQVHVGYPARVLSRAEKCRAAAPAHGPDGQDGSRRRLRDNGGFAQAFSKHFP